jgi:hypothetical protein
VSPNEHVDNGEPKPKTTPSFFAAGVGAAKTAKKNICAVCAAKPQPILQIFDYTSPRGALCLCTGDSGNTYSARLYICRVFFFCCDSVSSTQTFACAICAAKLRSSHRLLERTSPPGQPCLCEDEAGDIYSVLQLTCRVAFSCCGSVAPPQAAA